MVLSREKILKYLELSQLTPEAFSYEMAMPSKKFRAIMEGEEITRKTADRIADFLGVQLWEIVLRKGR